MNAFMNDFSLKSLKKLTALLFSQHKRHFVARTGELFSICDGAFRRKGQLAQLENKFQGKKFVYGGLLQNFRGFTNEPSSKLNFAIRSFFRFDELLTILKRK